MIKNMYIMGYMFDKVNKLVRKTAIIAHLGDYNDYHSFFHICIKIL